jgi:hypothetical protein
MDRSVYPNKDVIEASKLCVNIYCHNEKNHSMIKYGTEEWCEHVYGVKCEDHEKAHNGKSGKYFPGGTIPNPTSILCTPDGEEISRKKGAATPKELVDMMKEAAKKVGPGVMRDEYKFIKDQLAAAEEGFSNNKVKDGIEAANKVIKAFGKNPGAKPLVEMAQKKLDTANEYGKEKVQEARDLVAKGDVEGARAILKEIFGNYKGLECAKEAEKEFGALPKTK